MHWFWRDLFASLEIMAVLALGAIPIALIVLVVHVWATATPIAPGACLYCDYDLTGNTSGICPECGERI